MLAAQAFLGWHYSRDPRFPAHRPGIPKSRVELDGVNLGTDCSSGGAYILITATPIGRWDVYRYGELQIFDPSQPWSPIDAVERAGVGSRVDRPVAGLWHVTQVWHDASQADGDGVSGGHFRLSYAMPEDPDLLRVLEITNRGPGDGYGPTWSWARWTQLLAKHRDGGKAAALGPG